MKRRCVTCRAVIASGSYCPQHARRWRDDSGRLRGRAGATQRLAVIHAQGGRCGACGRTGAPLEVHHVNHDHTDNRAENLRVLCRSCHRRTE